MTDQLGFKALLQIRTGPIIGNLDLRRHAAGNIGPVKTDVRFLSVHNLFFPYDCIDSTSIFIELAGNNQLLRFLVGAKSISPSATEVPFLNVALDVVETVQFKFSSFLMSRLTSFFCSL